MPKQKKPTQRGALGATSRPGFGQVKKSVKREYYVLPLSESVNESIAEELMKLGAMETKSLLLPRHETKQNVYVVDTILLRKILSSPFKEYELFYRRGNGDMIYPYRSSKQKQSAKDRKAKNALKKTRLITTATS